ncbi:DUF4174 domain-containing protein [Salipiger mucosus]|uniref:Methylmalonyl-CoA epimerase n=1 Tax=Salipiger mucosus DSM 16094 TaxID=1123237 RepID=S9RWH4_9RHOB|nr:DUF4174 domain-containing protein [Salipiger mucosus]EPX78364.1 Methylmalonyl-CoA epimerase [Salipiger mucosus DSM 16094]
MFGPFTKLTLAVAAGTAAFFAATSGNAAEGIFRDLSPDRRDLSDLRWDKRPVLVFAPSGDSADYARQIALFEAAEAGLAERDIVVLSDVSPDRPGMLRQGFSPAGLKIVLVGKDGGVKLEQDRILRPAELFATIDAMPMRRREMSE